MKDQYSILSELKKIDDKLGRIKRDVESVPEEIQKIDQALTAQKQEFEKAKLSFETYEKELRKAESDLREKEDHLKKAEAKMMEVKTNEEYQAATKENDAQKRVKALIEDRILSLMSDIDKRKAAFATAEASFKESEKTLLASKATLQEEGKKLQVLFQEIVDKRNTAAARLSPDAASLFAKVTQRFKGVGALTFVDAGKCLSCNMKVRPQLFNEILGFKAIHQCPSCARIMVVVETHEETTTPA